MKLRQLWIALGWVLVTIIIFLSLTPEPPQIGIENGDKLGHLAAYGLVTLWFVQPYTALRQRIVLAFGMMALGVAMEYAQRATGCRTFEVADMVADATGVAIGWLLAPPRLPNLLEMISRTVWAGHG